MAEPTELYELNDPVLPARPAEPITPKPLAYQPPVRQQPPVADTVRDLYAPLWILGLSIVIEIVGAIVRQPTLARALVEVTATLIFGTIVMSAGLMLAMRMRAASLGHPGHAVIKVLAISVAPSAALTLLTPALVHIPFGMLLGVVATFVLYFTLLGTFFNLDESDTWLAVWVIFLIRLSIYFTVLLTLGR